MALAEKLKDPRAIARANVFPYQILAAYLNTAAELPRPLAAALEAALEIATANVPELAGKVYVCVDVSGSMSSSITGDRGSATSKVRCIDVAALVAATLLRQCKTCEVIPFEAKLVGVRLSPYDSVMTNAARLAAVGGGGTNCSAPLYSLNAKRAQGDLVVYVSDNESWMDSRPNAKDTALQKEWAEFKRRNPAAKLVSIDLTPNTAVQALSAPDVLNVGGFSDQVFTVIKDFANGRSGPGAALAAIEATSL